MHSLEYCCAQWSLSDNSAFAGQKVAVTQYEELPGMLNDNVSAPSRGT